jgi:protein-disulfide isomerase
MSMIEISALRALGFAAAASAALAVAGCNDTSGSSGQKPPAASGRPATEATTDVAELNKSAELPDQVLGKADAPVTVIEYASMTCGHCASFHTEKTNYIDTGKVKYIFREFPLDPVAYAASLLARCSGEAKFYPALDLLFKQQRAWAFTDKPEAALFETMKQTGMTQEQFNTCLQDQESFSKMQRERQRASQKFGVDSTPTFFINGKIVRGAMSPAALDKELQQHLEATPKP